MATLLSIVYISPSIQAKLGVALLALYVPYVAYTHNTLPPASFTQDHFFYGAESSDSTCKPKPILPYYVV